MRVFVSLSLMSLIVLAGCEQKPAPQPAANLPPVPTLPTVPQPAAPVAPQPAPPPATETVVAEVGVGQKGRSLDEHEGLVVTPVKALFSTRERVVFEIQIPHALNLFNATEGRMPKTHDEFMEKIIKANQIPLPELPPDNRYMWDPQTNELMVERPKAAALPQ